MSRLLKLSKFVRGLDFLKRKSHVSTATNSALEITLKSGDVLHDYTVTRVVPVKEFDITAVELVHQTGAQHLHISRRDSDNVFAVAVTTTPRDSTGIPHILEHVSLCGSEKFPVRDPFFKMYTRSLATFMNAFTANDWTMYPFSSQNAKDFENLLLVYLDAVFNPLLRRTDFDQEGWRLEHEKVDDQKSPIILKGVVFNEMKGVFSDHHQVYGQAAQNLLLPTGTYGVVSGGDPKSIPDLTWQQLKSFHQHHYHPSNARFFTYGDMPLEHHLDVINRSTLSKFQPRPIDTTVPLESRWSSPRASSVSCPVDHLNPDPQSDFIVSVNSLLCDITDLQEGFEVSILCNLLVDGEKAPFYRSLVESGLGSDYSPGTGCSNQTRDLSFSVGLQRVHKSNVDKVVKLVDETVDRVIEEGFEPQRVESVLHKIELSLKHQTEKFGLKMILSLFPSWNHGADPVHSLQVSRLVEELKRKLSANPRHLEELVRKYLKDNKHRLVLVSEPDPEYSAKHEKLESERLQLMVSGLSEAEREEVYTRGLELAEIQSKRDDTSCLPTLQISDIPKTHKKVMTKKITLRGESKVGQSRLPIQSCVQPTNGVSYVRLTSDVSTLPGHLRPYLPLFCHIMTKMGAGDLDYLQQSEKVDLKTGGLQADVLLLDHPVEFNKHQNAVTFSSFCLERNLNDMLDLWSDIFLSLSLTDHRRFFTLLSGLAAESASSLTSSGHRFAMIRSASSLGPSFELMEKFGGVEQLNFVKNLVKFVSDPSSQRELPYDPEKVEQVLGTMREIAQHVLSSNAGRTRASINAGGAVMDDAIGSLTRFHERLGRAGGSGTRSDSSISSDIAYVEEEHRDPIFLRSHLEFPFQVNYIGKSFLSVPLLHPHHAPLRVLGKILTSKFLHKEIREKGGAYGGGCDAGHNVFHFYSYRDPNFSKTLGHFRDSVDWAGSGKFSDTDVVEAKLSVFSQIDQPVSPGSQGMREFTQGITDEQFQELRRSVMSVSRDGIDEVVLKYLSDDSKASVAVIGPKNEASSSGWDVVNES